MFNVTICFVPPSGGEVDYQVSVKMPVIPNNGDYVSIIEEGGTCDFIVRRKWFQFKANGEETQFSEVYVEAEFAKGHTSNPRHLDSIKVYESRGNAASSFESSMY